VKKIHIIILVIVAAAIGIMVATFGSNLSSYETFASAKEKMGKTFHVSAVLDTSIGNVMYNPHENSNKLVFYAKDESGAVEQVTYYKGKPDGFERSEKLVMKGKMTENGFVCEDMQLKCPSKYEASQHIVME
jgi:cytochrome c-type biogenesis protein CcmE